MFDKKAQLKILKKNLNLGGLVADEIDQVLEPALQKVVEDSSNPFDDLLKASIYPILRSEIQKLLEKHVNTLFDSEEDGQA